MSAPKTSAFRSTILLSAAMKKPTHEEPAKIGRPARAGAAANIRIAIRVTEDEHARWSAAAKAEGARNLVAWLRAAAEARAKRTGR
jgi:hypothetical protein